MERQGYGQSIFQQQGVTFLFSRGELTYNKICSVIYLAKLYTSSLVP